MAGENPAESADGKQDCHPYTCRENLHLRH